jgi:hypothetical protein
VIYFGPAACFSCVLYFGPAACYILVLLREYGNPAACLCCVVLLRAICVNVEFLLRGPAAWSCCVLYFSSAACHMREYLVPAACLCCVVLLRAIYFGPAACLQPLIHYIFRRGDDMSLSFYYFPLV